MRESDLPALLPHTRPGRPLPARSPRPRCLPVPALAALLAIGWPASSGADIGGSAGAVGEAGSVLFVPAFYGAPTLDIGYETRFPSLLGDETPWATDAIGGGLGYLAYVDGHGRWALGGALRGTWALDPLLPGRSRFARIDLQLESRWRFQNRVFAHAAVSTVVEVGALLPRDVPEGEAGDAELRWAVLVASGPGLLFNSSPFLFGEAVAHLGLEAIHRPGGPAFSIIAGIRLRFDHGIRGRDLEPCEYNPVEFGECP